MASTSTSDTPADPRPPEWKSIIMSHPTPLDPKTDVTKEAKLNRICEKCSGIAHQIDNLTMRAMRILEAKDAVDKSRADELGKPSYRVKLSGYLRFTKPTQEYSNCRPISEASEVWIEHEVTGESHMRSHFERRLYIKRLFDGDSSFAHDRQDPSPSTASPSSFALARWWLGDCKENHPNCRHDNMSGFRDGPTRLIDVGFLRKPMSCRLCVPRRGFDRYEYLTLSHKWGGANMLKLTKSNFESMLKGIVISDLPLTFQHAITITRNLGYQHLWIDSLCIIQDDPNDWAFESSTMSRVYSKSVLTIAALWGDDSHSGCFVERNPCVTEDCRIGTWKHRNVIVKSDHGERGQPIGYVSPAPLLQRAWVLQERFLSPRTLFYGPWELYWECGERTTNESKPEDTLESPENTLKMRFRSMKETDLISIKISPQGRLWRHIQRDSWGIASNNSPQYTRLESNYDLWTKILAEYWSSSLTYHSDTLVALYGVTDVIKQKTGLHFVFGLCKEFLGSELLWEVKNANATVRSTLAPTWSWASVEKAELRSAYHHTDQYERHRRFSTFHTWTDSVGDSKGRDPSLNQKCLHLRGPLLHTTLKRGYVGYFNSNDSPLLKCEYKPDIDLPDTVDVACLVVAAWVLDSDEKNDICRGQAGLMLVPCPRDDNTYERVGVWRKRLESCPIDIFTQEGPKDIQSFRLV
ncbi:MAG: hypothetical protein Q9204_002276 [Flavoplaca sp. TL-2023a]